jgi:hypothetical protein
MKKLLLFYVVSSFVLGCTVYGLQKTHVVLPKLLHNYLNDFLVITIVLGLSLYLLQWAKNNKEYVLPFAIILYVCCLFSVLFEWYFPEILDRYTSDFFDVLTYFLSGIVFWYIQKLSMNSRKTKKH